MKTLKEWKKWIAAALCVALVFTQTGPVSYADEQKNEEINLPKISVEETIVTESIEENNESDAEESIEEGVEESIEGESVALELVEEELIENEIEALAEDENLEEMIYEIDMLSVEETNNYVIKYSESEDESYTDKTEAEILDIIAEHERNMVLVGYTGSCIVGRFEPVYEEVRNYDEENNVESFERILDHYVVYVTETYTPNQYDVTVNYVYESVTVETKTYSKAYNETYQFNEPFYYIASTGNGRAKYNEKNGVNCFVLEEGNELGLATGKYVALNNSDEITVSTTGNVITVPLTKMLSVELVVYNIHVDLEDNKETVLYIPEATVDQVVSTSRFYNLDMTEYTSGTWSEMELVEGVNTITWTGDTQYPPYTVTASNGSKYSTYYSSSNGEYVISAQWRQPINITVMSDASGSTNGVTVSYENNRKRKAYINLNGNKSAQVKVTVCYNGRDSESVVMFDNEPPVLQSNERASEEFNTFQEYTLIANDNEGGCGRIDSVTVEDLGPEGDRRNHSFLTVTRDCVQGENGQMSDTNVFHYTVTDNHFYEIKIKDGLGNTLTLEPFQETLIATESAEISVNRLPLGIENTENITATTESEAIWVDGEDSVSLLLKPDSYSHSDIVSASYRVGTNPVVPISLGENGLSGSSEGISVPVAGLEDLESGIYTIAVNAVSRAGVDKTYEYKIKVDNTKPSCIVEINDILPYGRGRAFSYQSVIPTEVYHNNVIVLNVNAEDIHAGLKTAEVKGFSVCGVEKYTIDLTNSQFNILEDNIPSEKIYVAHYSDNQSSFAIMLNTNNCRIRNSNIEITLYDNVGNSYVYEWEEVRYHISDGVRPVGQWTLSNQIIGVNGTIAEALIENVTTGKNETDPVILKNHVVADFYVEDTYLFHVLQDSESDEPVLDYYCEVEYVEAPNGYRETKNVEFTNTNMSDDAELMTWSSGLHISEEDYANKIATGKTAQQVEEEGLFGKDGLYTVTMCVKDVAGNYANFDETDNLVFSLYYDLTAPTVTADTDVEAGEDIWVNTDVTISGTVSDAKWGKVDAGYYTRISSTADTAPEFNAPASKDECSEYKALSFENGNFSVTNAATDEFNGYYYFWVYDTVGNVSEVKSVRVRVDSTAPEADMKVDTNIIYNEDVEVEVSAKEIKEAGLNSGLKQISYEIYNGDKVTSTGTMAGVEGKDSYTGTIKVIAKENEGDKIFVKILVTDIAGNEEKFTSESFKIDVTKPVIEVSYDNNDVSNEIYFHASRTATVVITEHNFDSEKVKFETTGTIGAFTSNGDEHVAKVTFAVDGEHTIAVSCVDKAKNESEETKFSGVSPKEFTVDLTNPRVTITYSNNSSRNGSYYNDGRVATIAVIERNFDAASATAGVIVKNLSNGSVPVLSGWSTSGDAHTATLSFTDDAEYEIEISFEDLATNVSETVEPEKFVLDQLLPVVNIAGVSDHTAYNAAEVAPVITVSDTNYDVNGVIITLTGVVDSSVATLYPTASADLGYAHRFEFANIEEDGLYTLSVQVTDLAGNVTDAYISEDGSNYNGNISFSVNRNGSVYTVSEDTKKVLDKFYLNEEKDIVITETNVDILTDMQILVSKDNNQTALADLTGLTGSRLEEGAGYIVERSEVKGGWSQYTYTISKDNFAEDGVYHIALCSVDAAGNTADSELAEETMGISFIVDKTAPIYIVSDLESGVVYDTDEKVVTFTAKDNIALEKVKVYVNGEETASWSEEEIRELQSRNADFNFTIYEDVTEQTVMITCVDKAGNHSEDIVIDQILVTTNWFVRFRHNDNLVAGTSVAAAVVFVGGVTGFGFKRRRRFK